ncbi:hypothetical protein L207DRAFT_588371 [Hyaloscypha variabilis F]|uniref:Secreted protein n=1 Tax=Hyaloscypha variabilis (strain UAMH 11265 / GT02V1 / F) TaxID=1149755 RepID=A0A2J6R8N4_HYAVF|nr:hypothetical protein L207DRAFT_588371 [Hyaloscypha variabilis F]
MIAPTFLQILGLSALLLSTSAFPATNSNEIYYLANCSKCDITDDNCPYYRSLMAYYLDASKSENGQLPTATSEATGLLTWEGNTILGSFTGAKDPDFSATIDQDALNSQFYNIVGSGKTESHNFTCYKDSDRLLYRKGPDYCYSIYWCQWVGQG